MSILSLGLTMCSYMDSIFQIFPLSSQAYTRKASVNALLVRQQLGRQPLIPHRLCLPGSELHHPMGVLAEPQSAGTGWVPHRSLRTQWQSRPHPCLQEAHCLEGITDPKHTFGHQCDGERSQISREAPKTASAPKLRGQGRWRRVLRNTRPCKGCGGRKWQVQEAIQWQNVEASWGTQIVQCAENKPVLEFPHTLPNVSAKEPLSQIKCLYKIYKRLKDFPRNLESNLLKVFLFVEGSFLFLFFVKLIIDRKI